MPHPGFGERGDSGAISVRISVDMLCTSAAFVQGAVAVAAAYRRAHFASMPSIRPSFNGE